MSQTTYYIDFVPVWPSVLMDGMLPAYTALMVLQAFAVGAPSDRSEFSKVDKSHQSPFHEFT